MKREFEMIYRGQTKDPIGQHDAGAVGTADRGVSSTAQAVGRVGVRHAGDARRPPRPRHAQNHRETRTIPIVNERKQTSTHATEKWQMTDVIYAMQVALTLLSRSLRNFKPIIV